jgi:hypothetical protein
MPLASKLLRAEIVFTLMFLPLLIWLALYLVATCWSVNLCPALSWLRILRWLGWGLGVALFIVGLAHDSFPRIYGLALISFSVGLSMPQGWIKRRFAPELLEPERDWWPAKS